MISGGRGRFVLASSVNRRIGPRMPAVRNVIPSRWARPPGNGRPRPSRRTRAAPPPVTSLPSASSPRRGSVGCSFIDLRTIIVVYEVLGITEEPHGVLIGEKVTVVVTGCLPGVHIRVAE